MPSIEKGLTWGLILLALWQVVDRFLLPRVRGPGVAIAAVVPTLPGRPVPPALIQLAQQPRPVQLQGLLGGCSIVYFFDSDCPACRESAPHWKAANELPVYFLSIADSLPEALAFKNEFTLPHEIGVVLGDGPASVVGVPAVPTVWGVEAGFVTALRTGASASHPDSLDSEWCSNATL